MSRQRETLRKARQSLTSREQERGAVGAVRIGHHVELGRNDGAAVDRIDRTR
jgi:hypothetical protein